jgi:adenylate cyclase
MGASGRALEPLEEGVRLLEQAGQPLEAARHRLTLGRCRWERSDPGRGRADYERALQALEPAGPSPELALAYIRLAGLHVFNYEAEPARELAEKAISTATAANADDMRIWALNFLGIAVAYGGDYSRGTELLEQSADEAMERGLYNIGGNALHNLFAFYIANMQMEKLRELIPRLEAIRIERWGTLSWLFVTSVWAHEIGDASGAVTASQELRAHALALGDVSVEQIARAGLALDYMELAQYDEAREHLVKPTHNSDAQDAVGDSWLWLRFHLAADDLPRALDAAELLLTLPDPASNDDGAVAAVEAFVAAGRLDEAELMVAALEASPQPVARYGANLARAHIALVRGDTAKARAGVEEAVAAFQSAGMVLRELNARLQLAEIHIHEDDAKAAESEFKQVLEVSRRLGLLRLGRAAEVGLAGLGIVVEERAPQHTARVHAPTEMGERLVTVMFADVRGYTALAGGRPPAEMVDLIATYQRWAAQEIERHMGVVDKFAGDAVMATFNISGNQVDHAAHALQAALALRDKAGMLGLPVGIGIATGPAVVGTLKTGANLSVVGETTNLASRLQSQAAAGEILLSEESYRRLRDAVVAAQEQLTLKGFDHPVGAYRVAARATS